MKVLVCMSTVIMMLSQTVLAVNPTSAFQKANLVPDVFPVAPQNVVSVSYPTAEVCLGNEISASQTIYVPKVSYSYKPGVNYTLIYLNPDLPSAAASAHRSTINWMVVNIPGDKVKVGYRIASYTPAIGIQGAGYQRYTYLVFAQCEYLDIKNRDLLRIGVNRFGVSIPELAKKYCLTLVAGNYFVSRLPVIKDEYYCKDKMCKLYSLQG